MEKRWRREVRKKGNKQEIREREKERRRVREEKKGEK